MGIWKKAQGATEYLIILAVVIIIALIVVGVMGGIPGIGGGGRSKAIQAYWSSTDVAIDSASLSAASDLLTLKLRNNQRNAVTVTNVDVGTDVADEGDLPLNPGQSGTFPGIAVVCANAGDSFSVNVTITYTDQVTSGSYSVTGDQNLEGKCTA